MATKTNTPNAQNRSTILSASDRISQIIASAEKNNADLSANETEEVDALTRAIFASTPSTRIEAAAVYKTALEHLECATDNVAGHSVTTLHRALAAAQPLLCAA